MLSDLEIAQRAKMKHVYEIAGMLGIGEDDIELYGKYKAKISLDVLEKFKKKRTMAKYIDVTAITPTPLGEGKTVTTIGLSQALNHVGKLAICCIRQPSMGPTFGIKGGAAGGGYSQVVPMEDFNLHLTGDIHAVGVAHNLLAAFIDNHISKGNTLEIEPTSIAWNRVVDISDRALRDIVIGLGGKANGIPRQTGFDITVASEIMAVLALCTSLEDLRKRLGRIIIGETTSGTPVTADDLRCAGAMTVLMRDAVKPTLMQTIENTPVLVHAGPFANIAHGNSSIIADLIATRTGEFVVTESGFGADIGAEKFFNIKCRASGLRPNAAVLVTTVRALKMHSGRFKVVAGKLLDTGLLKENIKAVEEGAGNLVKQIENIRLFGVPVVVAINRFDTDTAREHKTVKRIALEAGAQAAVVSNMWAKGGKGGVELAEAVIEAAETPTDFRFLYELDAPLKEKIMAIATRIYGASGVDFSPLATKQIDHFTALGFGNLPICMAKTHLSLSHDSRLKGRPVGFELPIREVRLSAGAGFVYPLVGEIRTMPGLPTVPAGANIDIDDDGKVVGLF
ncbi:formate--tetrahydrofolate ligase [bacterium]|nr:formate--tetrahydrofolate ligase [bacterium]